jgi:rhodanese-related sulfurtransferase
VVRGKRILEKDGNEAGPKMTFHFIRPADMYSLKGQSELGRFNLVDVRSKEEFARGHLEGAVCIPVSEIDGRVAELDPERTTLVYCQKGKRCLQAADLLARKGFDDILVLDGGLDAYSEYLARLK